MNEVKFKSISGGLSSERKYPPIYKRKKQKSEFDALLESYRNETVEDLEEYPVHLPKSELFYDNGYEDVSGL